MKKKPERNEPRKADSVLLSRLFRIMRVRLECLFIVSSLVSLSMAGSQPATATVKYSVPLPKAPVGSSIPFSEAAASAHYQTSQAATAAGYNIHSQFGLSSLDPRLAGWGHPAAQQQYSSSQLSVQNGYPYGTGYSPIFHPNSVPMFPQLAQFRSLRHDADRADAGAERGGGPMRFASARSTLGVSAESGSKATSQARSASEADAALAQAEKVLAEAQKVSLLHPQTGEAKAISGWHSAYRPAQMRVMGKQAIEAWKEQHARFVSRRAGGLGKDASEVKAHSTSKQGREEAQE